MKAWELPRPRAYIEEIVSELSRKRNVAIALPAADESWFFEGIRKSLDDLNGRDLKIFEVAGREPRDVLGELLGESFIVDDPRALTEALRDYVDTRVFCIVDLGERDLKAWTQLVSSYIKENQNRPDDTVPFLLVLPDRMTAPGLNLLAPRDVARAEDAVLLATINDAVPSANRNEARLRACIAGVLAQWDLSCATELAQESLDRLCSPIPLLRDIALRRGWHPSNPPDWAQGQISSSGELHSAWCAILGKGDIIMRRLWSAQATILFPLLEEKRQVLLKQYARYLPTPNSETVLELADIDDKLRICGAPKEFSDESRRARYIRNDLAHLECISAFRIQTLLGEMRE